MEMTMTTITALEEAAEFLAHGNGEAALAGARATLGSMGRAVETILGESAEVLRRTSKSSGTERLSFVMGEIAMPSQAAKGPTGDAAHCAGVLAKGQEVFNYLIGRGVDAERVTLGSQTRGVGRHAVDVILNDKALQFVPGKRAAAIIGGNGKGTVVPPFPG
jgi:hypothetical protein